MANPNRCTVKHLRLKGVAVAEALAALDDICAAGASCQEVQGSPVGAAAHTVLQATVATAHQSMAQKLGLISALLAATRGLQLDVAAAAAALSTYESAVNAIADGNGATINRAGLASRDPSGAPASLGQVTTVSWKQGKNPSEAILTWPAAPGATCYAVEVNLTPEAPTGNWTSAGTGTNRRRVIKAPSPGARLLVRVAAVDSDGTPSEWSDPILVTAR